MILHCTFPLEHPSYYLFAAKFSPPSDMGKTFHKPEKQQRDGAISGPGRQTPVYEFAGP